MKNGNDAEGTLREPFGSLVDVCRQRARQQGSTPLYTFLGEQAEVESVVGYAELDRRCRAIAAELASRGKQGDRVLLLHPPGRHFVEAFLGCLYAGRIAVPAYPPDPARPERTLPRLRAIARDAGPALVATTREIAALAAPIAEQVGELRDLEWLAGDGVPDDRAEAWSPPPCAPDTIAFLQYTSGSTSDPKGVVLTHGNLLANLASIAAAFGHHPRSQGFIWLPPYHDMGLIGGILQPLFAGFPVALMSPLAFLRQPVRWLEGISRHRATTSGGPSFAYELCVRKITPEQRASLDLSCWELAFCGAEPIQIATLRRFAERFRECGFREEAFYPCFGLAEATLMVAGAVKGAGLVTARYDADALRRGEVRPAAEGQELVGCGASVPGHRLAIVDPERLEPAAPGRIGEIWFEGPSVARGYWNAAAASEDGFRSLPCLGAGRFVRTGDLGFVDAGELFVVGRRKDVIKLFGRAWHPQDLEQTIEAGVPELRPGGCVAFACEGESERVGVVAELRPACIEQMGGGARLGDGVRLVAAIRAAVAREHGIPVHRVALALPGAVRKTSSGKLRRGATRDALGGGAFEPLYEDAIDAASEPRASRSPARVDDARGRELAAWLREYAPRRLQPAVMDERRCIQPHVVLDFAERGFFGLHVPAEHGGLGLPYAQAMLPIEQLAAIDLSLALFVGLHNSLGIAPLLRHGSPSLRERWIPRLARGTQLAAFALTEACAGSNPRAMQATSRRHPEGGWVLDATKIWSGSAAWAGVIHVFARRMAADGSAAGVNGFAVACDAPGVRAGPEALTFGMRGMVQNTMVFEQVRVPDEALLGVPGSGLDVAQEALLLGRLGLGAMCVGAMKRALRLMLRYADRRTIASGRLVDHATARDRIGRAAASILALSALVDEGARALDDGALPVDSLVACKSEGAELLWDVVDDLVQILGGRGYIETNEAPRLVRDARVLRIFEGPTETLRAFLGARVFEGGGALAGRGGDDEALRLLARTAAQCREALRSGSAGDRNATLEALGEAAGTALLLRALEAARAADPALRACARAWLGERLERACDRAVGAGSSDARWPRGDAWVRELADWLAPVADCEIDEPGASRERDPLLRAHPISVSRRGDRPNERPPERADADPRRDVSGPERERVEAWLRAWLERNLQVSALQVRSEEPLSTYGIDSVSAVTLAEELGSWLGRPLDAVIVWDHPSVAALARMATASEPVRRAPARAAPAAFEREREPDAGGVAERVAQLSDDEVLLRLDLARQAGR